MGRPALGPGPAAPRVEARKGSASSSSSTDSASSDEQERMSSSSSASSSSSGDESTSSVSRSSSRARRLMARSIPALAHAPAPSSLAFRGALTSNCAAVLLAHAALDSCELYRRAGARILVEPGAVDWVLLRAALRSLVDQEVLIAKEKGTSRAKKQTARDKRDLGDSRAWQAAVARLKTRLARVFAAASSSTWAYRTVHSSTYKNSLPSDQARALSGVLQLCRSLNFEGSASSGSLSDLLGCRTTEEPIESDIDTLHDHLQEALETCLSASALEVYLLCEDKSRLVLFVDREATALDLGVARGSKILPLLQHYLTGPGQQLVSAAAQDFEDVESLAVLCDFQDWGAVLASTLPYLPRRPFNIDVFHFLNEWTKNTGPGSSVVLPPQLAQRPPARLRFHSGQPLEGPPIIAVWTEGPSLAAPTCAAPPSLSSLCLHQLRSSPEVVQEDLVSVPAHLAARQTYICVACARVMTSLARDGILEFFEGDSDARLKAQQRRMLREAQTGFLPRQVFARTGRPPPVFVRDDSAATALGRGVTPSFGGYGAWLREGSGEGRDHSDSVDWRFCVCCIGRHLSGGGCGCLECGGGAAATPREVAFFYDS